MVDEHILAGIEPDNLLGFLALLGAMRALEAGQPDWYVRAYWSGTPLRPRLVVRPAVAEGELAQAIADGCARLASVHQRELFEDAKDLTYAKEDARRLLKAACGKARAEERLTVDLLSALMSDAAVKDDGKIRATPFCAMFGQGHQCFLERMVTVPSGELPKGLRKSKKPPDLNSPQKIAEALFRTWDRCDETESFRWDPQEDRRYALRAENPSGDKGLTVHGANRLASLALPLLTAVPVISRGEVRLAALGTEAGERGALCARWPIWSKRASLAAIREMLAGCAVDGRGVNGVSRPAPGLELKGIMKADRISVGKYFNFTRAVME